MYMFALIFESNPWKEGDSEGEHPSRTIIQTSPFNQLYLGLQQITMHWEVWVLSRWLPVSYCAPVASKSESDLMSSFSGNLLPSGVFLPTDSPEWALSRLFIRSSN